ncbi:NIPSNAP family protein [Algoriphagus sediminis]|uniref:NIPSNAP family protein n=1 Tax=Algoriphagus sediminis TaxID=3057113 RepID=A0ABT7Y8U3_9BACT|nr:NIPSNAP family protein [Algoriphagus sediminis]MDN3202938.1 NIPSNAP family protein [Algoriphagus sediminis]
MKKTLNTVFLSLMAFLMVSAAHAQEAMGFQSKYFEIRKYYAHEGKLEDLIARFENHTFSIFERIGMENIAYFLPVDNQENTLIYILGYPDKASRDRLWEQFLNDAEWTEAYQKSTENGALVKRIEETFMVLAPGLNQLPKPLPSGVIQMRTYHCFDDKLFDLQRRFKDHTQELFERQGLRNYLYWVTDEEDGSQSKLVYLLGHRNQMAFDEAFQNFLKDPDWIKARDESEANGKIVEKVDAVMLKTLPFSPIK